MQAQGTSNIQPKPAESSSRGMAPQPLHDGLPATADQQQVGGFAPNDKSQPAPATAVPAYAAGNTNASSNTAKVATTSGQARSNANNEQYQKEAERIVAEEREASEKMPYYEGLSERFQLISKMGDGAFSNVYKARDKQTGQKVAVKVVRKYELNSNQVRTREPLFFGSAALIPSPPISYRWSCLTFGVQMRLFASRQGCRLDDRPMARRCQSFGDTESLPSDASSR
ncbi:hypothetical protein IE53DRAFT_49064 [Violaceomyces palustris]|uniref:Uncharacterized protein n=1 Tax=Violaceomyces palustris TaxID=1673888 RepID=A0ACD0P0F4_9BASI|nr:hypothetical protein IE53DRAFT_49064 [Violaceomyces palustris]